MEEFLRDSPLQESERDYRQSALNPATNNSNTSSSNQSNFPNIGSGTDFELDPALHMFSETPDLDNVGFGYDQNVAPEEPQNDSYLDAFDYLNLPSQQLGVAAAGIDVNFNTDFASNIGFQDAGNNLDQLISPENNAYSSNTGGVLPTGLQYFSPPKSRGGQFAYLNAISENQMPAFVASPTDLRHGSVSVHAPLYAELYLSPRAFLSPQLNAYDGSFDTLKSPYLGLLINSPPPPLSLSQTANIPPTQTYLQPLHQNTQGQLGLQGQTQPVQILNVSSPPPTYSVTGTSAPTDGLSKSADRLELSADEKARRRREFHNAVERRRRDHIKEKIKELGQLVPLSLLTPLTCAVQHFLNKNALSEETRNLLNAVKVKEAKPNKATILLRSVDYITHLQYVIDKQQKRRQEIEQKIQELRQNDMGTSRGLSAAASSEFDPDEFLLDVVDERVY